MFRSLKLQKTLVIIFSVLACLSVSSFVNLSKAQAIQSNFVPLPANRLMPMDPFICYGRSACSASLQLGAYVRYVYLPDAEQVVNAPASLSLLSVGIDNGGYSNWWQASGTLVHSGGTRIPIGNATADDGNKYSYTRCNPSYNYCDPSMDWFNVRIPSTAPVGSYTLEVTFTSVLQTGVVTSDGFINVLNVASSAAPVATAAPVTTAAPVVTIPAVLIPATPSSLLVTKISDSSIRLSFVDASTNEDGFIFQRDDVPVAVNTTAANWPYRASAGTTTFDLGGLVSGKRYCITAAAYNSGGVSSWAQWACLDLVASTASNSGGTSSGLTCDGARKKLSGSSVNISIAAGTSNAGRKLIFEAFVKGKWVKIGNGRVDASGSVGITTKTSIVGKTGKVAIRATQGSRFICEGNIS